MSVDSTEAPNSVPETKQTPEPPRVTPEQAQRARIGVFIAMTGLALFAPAIVIAVVSDAWRFPAGLAALAFWFVWKIGRGIQRANSGLT